MTECYRTIKAPVTGEITEKKSRFIASITPLSDAESARSFVESTKKTFHDARHNCYAYILGVDGSEVKYSDDGEPQGTAGRPMLEVLRGNELTNICAVVTRYFGGVLLGTGGLSRAYSGALSEALKDADIITMNLMDILSCRVDYTLTGKLMHIFEKRGITIKDTDYSNSVKYKIALPPGSTDPLIRDITELSGGSAVIEKCRREYTAGRG